jgi:hypothetical protein
MGHYIPTTSIECREQLSRSLLSLPWVNRGDVLAGTSEWESMFVRDCEMSISNFGGLKVLISGNERRRRYRKTEAWVNVLVTHLRA